MGKDIVAKLSERLSSSYDKRYVIVNTSTGEILDDAQGYGYRSPQKAYAGYAYKTRDKSKDAERKARKNQIRKWLKENKEFVDELDICAFDCVKGSGSPDDKVDSKLVKRLLSELNIQTEFTPHEILKCWRIINRI